MSVLNKIDSGEQNTIGISSRRNFISSSAWEDVNELRKSSVHCKTCSSPNKKRKIEHWATLFSYKSQSDFKIMRFDNQPKCSFVKGLIGCMALVGFQKKMRYRYNVVSCKVNDVANLVTYDNVSYSISKQCSLKQTLYAPTIDLVFGERGVLVRI
jgi:hypothetical protein